MKRSKPIVGKPSRQIDVGHVIGNTRAAMAAGLEYEVVEAAKECDVKDVLTMHSLVSCWRECGDLLQAVEIVLPPINRQAQHPCDPDEPSTNPRRAKGRPYEG